MSHKIEEEEKSTEEGVELYDFRYEMSYQYRVDSFEDTTVPVKVTEIISVNRIDGLCKEIISNQYIGTSRVFVTEDVVIHRVSSDDVYNLQIVMSGTASRKIDQPDSPLKNAGHPVKSACTTG